MEEDDGGVGEVSSGDLRRLSWGEGGRLSQIGRWMQQVGGGEDGWCEDTARGVDGWRRERLL